MDFSCLTQEEKNDPLAVKWLQSNDVLTAEVAFLEAETARVRAALTALRSRGGNIEEEEENLEMEEGDIQNRQFLVESMLSVLVHQVTFAHVYTEVICHGD